MTIARILAAILLVLAGLSAGAQAERGPNGGPGSMTLAHLPAAATGSRVAQGVPRLTREYLVGTWETRVRELGQEVRIRFITTSDGRCSYRFDNGLGWVDGSTGTWALADGDTLVESWEKPVAGAGRGRIEVIDRETFRLTIIDNGHPAYKGLVRIYRRVGEGFVERGAR